jgi:hypothetical protein
MASDSNVNLSAGLPETVLSPVPGTWADELASAGDDPAAVAAVVARHPRYLAAWATLGELAERSGGAVEAYAYFRVGYHRGLDALRQSGWRGSGYVRWREPNNLGFLRALDGLRRQAAMIGEDDEAARCADFLHQLDPERRPAS